jgi:mannose-1-phosphate guanylyltransferase/mannose-6-phosphate isomerase
LRDILPILLSGGAGSRLWPVSRKAMPKQFARLIGEESLFTSTARRMSDLDMRAPMVVSGETYRFLVRDQLTQAGVASAHILIEPEGRNTAPAILAAALVAEEMNPGGLFLAAPCDHLMTDTEGFGRAIDKGINAAKDGAIVTFGITPTRPETGYGYLELAGDTASGGAVPLARFVEKPDAKTAATMLASGRYLWNAGIFLARSDTLIAAFQAQQPAMLAAVREATANRRQDLGFERLAAEPWQTVESLSIDYAIMESFEQTMAVPYRGGWSDLGLVRCAGLVRSVPSKTHCGQSRSGPLGAKPCAPGRALGCRLWDSTRDGRWNGDPAV